jgi:peptidyl-prolyl cis-trans isomerase D
MLERFRKYQQNFIFSILILAIVAVMALYGIDQLRDSDAKSGGAAAWVNGEAIPMQDFLAVLEATTEQYRARLGDQLDERFLAQFQVPQRTLDEMVQYKLLAQQATKLGFRVTDEELASTIRKAPAFQKDGKFDPELYRKLPNRGLEEKRIRESMLIRRMQSYLASRVALSPEMIDREYQLKETKVNLSYARIDFKTLAGKNEPSDSDVKTFLGTATPESIKAYYDGHQRDFSVPAGFNLKQIRVGVPFQASAEKKADAKKKMEAIAKEVTAANFEAMAKKHSDDEHAKKGGVVGWVNQGTLEKAMETAIQKLQPGEVSPVVESSFGYYVFQVKELRPESTKPLEAVKAEIGRALLKEKRSTDFIAKKKAEWETKLAAGNGIESELKAAGIEIKKTGPFSAGQGFIPQVGQSDEILDAVFKLSKAKPYAPKLYTSGTDQYFIKLETVEAPKASELAANRESLATNLSTQLQSAFLTQWVEKLKEGASIRIEAKFETPAAPNPFQMQ